MLSPRFQFSKASQRSKRNTVVFSIVALLLLGLAFAFMSGRNKPTPPPSLIAPQIYPAQVDVQATMQPTQVNPSPTTIVTEVTTVAADTSRVIVAAPTSPVSSALTGTQVVEPQATLALTPAQGTQPTLPPSVANTAVLPTFTPRSTVPFPPAALSTTPPVVNTSRPSPTAKQVKPSPTRKPPVANGTPILSTGARYGDHNPNVPGRVVRIAAPSIKLDTKVYEVYAIKGAWEVADYAAGHQFNSKNPGDGGNIVLSGHNNWHGEVFRYLENLQPGDEIDIWTQAGTRYTYKVRLIEKLKEAGVSYAQRLKNGEVMNDTPQEQLTLISCWPYTTYTHRLIVIADPVVGAP